MQNKTPNLRIVISRPRVPRYRPKCDLDDTGEPTFGFWVFIALGLLVWFGVVYKLCKVFTHHG